MSSAGCRTYAVPEYHRYVLYVTATTTKVPNAAYEATNAQDHSRWSRGRPTRVVDTPDSSSELVRALAPPRPRNSSVVSPETSASLLEPRACPAIADTLMRVVASALLGERTRDEVCSRSVREKLRVLKFDELAKTMPKFLSRVLNDIFTHSSLISLPSSLQNRSRPIRADDAFWHPAPSVCAHPGLYSQSSARLRSHTCTLDFGPTPYFT